MGIHKAVYVVGGIIAAVIILIIALVVSSIKKLNSDEVGVKYNNYQKKLASTPTYAGLHPGPPGYYFIKFPSVFKTLEFKALECLTNDGVEVALSLSYQYKIRGSNIRETIMQFRDFETFTNILHYVGESAVHDCCSQFNMTMFKTDRGMVQNDLKKRLVTKYDSIGADITDMQVNNIKRPSRYDNAIRQKERAREDIVVAMNEKPQALTAAQTEYREAETQANIIKAKANSEARILIKRASAEAAAIMNQYTEEAATYKRLVSSDGLGLSSEGLLSYIGIRMIENAESPVTVGIKAPAKVSYAAT